MIGTFDAAVAPRASGLLKRLAGAALALSLVGMVGMTGGEAAFAAGPFTGMGGSWAGSGTVAMDSGTKERMRCSAQYLVKDNDNNLQQSLSCSSPSYDLKVNTYVSHSAGALSGYWEELRNNVRGTVAGTANGNRVRVHAERLGLLGDAESGNPGINPVGGRDTRPGDAEAVPAGRGHAAQARLTPFLMSGAIGRAAGNGGPSDFSGGEAEKRSSG